MIDILLLPVMIGMFIYGYFIMRRLDHFLAGQLDSIVEPSQVMEPDCIMLNADMPEEKIFEELRVFREKHKHGQIILLSDDRSPGHLQNSSI